MTKCYSIKCKLGKMEFGKTDGGYPKIFLAGGGGKGGGACT